jgi:hypothetical protein
MNRPNRSPLRQKVPHRRRKGRTIAHEPEDAWEDPTTKQLTDKIGYVKAAHIRDYGDVLVGSGRYGKV